MFVVVFCCCVCVRFLLDCLLVTLCVCLFAHQANKQTNKNEETIKQTHPASKARQVPTPAITANIGSGSPPASACRGNLPPCFHSRPEPRRGGLRRDRFRCPASPCPWGTAITAQGSCRRLCATQSPGPQNHDGSASQLRCTSTLVGLCRRRPGSHTLHPWDTEQHDPSAAWQA